MQPIAVAPMPANDDLVLYAAILGCEIGFWLVLLLALAMRYIAGQRALSRALLLSLPVIDLALLVFTALDLRRGAEASFAHGLAAAYIGFTLAFGSTMVRWADRHLAHRFAAAAAPPKTPSRGWALVRYDLELWARCVVACVITVALVELLRRLAGEAGTVALLGWYRYTFGCVVLWFLFGPLWSLATAWRHPR